MTSATTTSERPHKVIKINDQWTRVIDKTKEQAVSVSGYLPERIFWRKVPIVWQDHTGMLRTRVYSKDNYTSVVEITNGQTPGTIVIKEKKLPEDWEKPARVIVEEVDTTSLQWQKLKKIARDALGMIHILSCLKPILVAKSSCGQVADDQSPSFYQVFESRIKPVCEEKSNF